MKMNRIIFSSLLLFTSCNDSVNETKFPVTRIKQLSITNYYKNKPKYSINIGDTIEIYHTTNSCCNYCQPNADELQHLVYIGSKIVIPSKKDCEGCNYTSALMFVAKSAGIDTIKDVIIPPLSECNESVANLNKYIVRIK
jgi:hypothetical protein